MNIKIKIISIFSSLLISLSVASSDETITIGDVEMASDTKSAALSK